MSTAPPEESADNTRAGWRIVLLVLLAFAEFVLCRHIGRDLRIGHDSAIAGDDLLEEL